MATIYWAGGTDTDIDDFNNYVTAAGGSTVIADNSGDFSGDDVIFQAAGVSGVGDQPTVNANETFNSVQVDANAVLTGNASYSITVDGKNGSNYAFDLNGGLGSDNTLNIIFTSAGGGNIDIEPATGDVSNHPRTVTINASGQSFELQRNAVLKGDLTITAGTLSTSSGDKSLTVTGDVSVTGTLTGNASAISMGSLTIASGGTYSATSGTTTITSIKSGDKSLENQSGGTFTNNDGTVLFNSNADQKIEMAGTGNVHNVTLNKSDNDFIWMGNYTFEGNFDITLEATHQARPTGTGNTLTVTEDVIVREGILLRSANDCTGAMSFGSLTIESGGTYAATSGTTTLTGKDTGSGTSFLNSGTFTHNNGKVKVTYAAASTQLTSAAFYDLEIATGTVSYIVKLYHGTAVDIYNNLTLTSGVLDMYVADDLIDIHGLTNIASGARCWYSADDNTNTITHHGLVTNLGIFYINDGTTVKLNGGIRQLGTLTIS